MMKKVSHPSRLAMGILSFLFLVGVGFFAVSDTSYGEAGPLGGYAPTPGSGATASPDPGTSGGDGSSGAAAPSSQPGTSCKNPLDIGCQVQQAFGKLIGIIIGALGQLLIAFMWLILQVGQYNGFITSTAVTMGWAVIRDICNMFFVLFLLVIAIGTILQQQQYHYTKTLPKFLTNVLLINFSLTICGVIIDLSQVFMMTFFSAFADSGAGNFAVLLGIPTLMSASAGGQINAFQTMSGFILALIYILVATVVVLLILIQLIVRIVALWFLVILSPFAFFLSTIPGLDKKGYVEKWWDSFTNFVVVGPALAFFLWLSLAVASGAAVTKDTNGNETRITNAKEAATSVATKELLGGEEASAEAKKVWPNESQASDMSNPTSALSFLIGIGLLLGGLMTAQEIASGSSKFAGSAIKTGNDFVMGRRGPVKDAKEAAGRAGKFALGRLQTGVATGFPGIRGAVGGALGGLVRKGAERGIPGMAALGALAGGIAALRSKKDEKKGELEKAQSEGRPDDAKKIEKELKGMDRLERAANLFAAAAEKTSSLAKAVDKNPWLKAGAVAGGMIAGGPVGWGLAAASLGGDFARHMKKKGKQNMAHAQNFDYEQTRKEEIHLENATDADREKIKANIHNSGLSKHERAANASIATQRGWLDQGEMENARKMLIADKTKEKVMGRIESFMAGSTSRSSGGGGASRQPEAPTGFSFNPLEGGYQGEQTVVEPPAPPPPPVPSGGMIDHTAAAVTKKAA